MDFVKREHVFDDETYKAYIESLQKQQQTASFQHAASMDLQQAVHGSLVVHSQGPRPGPTLLHRQLRHYSDMKTDHVTDDRDVGLNDLELHALSQQSLVQTIPEQDLSRIAAELTQRLRSAADAQMGLELDLSHRDSHGADRGGHSAGRGQVLPAQSVADKTPYIKLEQNDEYYYIAPQESYGGANGVGGLITTDPPRETPLFAHYPAHAGSALAPLDPFRAHNYPPNYIQSDPQNLVVQKFEPYAQQNGGQQNGGQQNGGQQNGGQQNGGQQNGVDVKAEEPNENVRPSEHSYYDYAVEGVKEDGREAEPPAVAVKVHYGCYKCALEFTTKRGLKQHSKVCLDDDKPTSGKVLCPQCPYTCHSSAILKIHERTHTGEKPFSCTFCEYKSGQKNNVAKHMMLHMQEKPFRCQYCEYRCAQKNNLVVHERTHTGYKPFACSYCEYRTVQKANLVKHMYLHTDQKPFSCDLCSYKCVQKTNLTKHKLRHAKDSVSVSVSVGAGVSVSVKCREKMLKCDQCHYSCVQKASLARHVSAKHGDGKKDLLVSSGKDFEFVSEGPAFDAES